MRQLQPHNTQYIKHLLKGGLYKVESCGKLFQLEYVLIFVLCVCTLQTVNAQEEDGVVSLSVPVRNSLTFNRYTINPTLSFVREQHNYISLYNKREWVQFEDAPETYLLSYAGRFAENIGAGVGLFQQNYGILTTFGGIVNFAYNVRLQQDSNLTFGLNLGVYKSGINTGNVVTNYPDASLDNVPSHLLLTVNPGINYGTAFLDFGVSINNLVLYNVQSSELIQDDPRQSIQAHLMYTGYMNSRGFFDEAKFSGLIRSEFGKESTTVSAIAMLTVPKGIWAQVGYNTLYGGTAGLGLNITPQIAIEYNFEKALGDLTDFGPSHDITLAFKFNNRTRYDYSDEDEMSALFTPNQKPVLAANVKKVDADTRAQRAAASAAKREEIRARAKEKSEARAQLAEEKKAVEIKKEINAITEVEEKATIEVETDQAKEAQALKEAEANAKREAEAKLKSEQDAKAKLAAQQSAKAEADAAAKRAAQAKAEQEAKEKLAAQEKIKAEELARVKAEAQAKSEAEAAAKENQEAVEAAKAKQLEDEKARADALKAEQLAAEAKAKQLAEAEVAQKAKEELIQQAIENPKDALGASIKSIAVLAEESKNVQQELLSQFSEIVTTKNDDLKDLKEENDLSEQGIYRAPKPFKSITDENNKLAAIKTNLDQIIATNDVRIKEFEKLIEERSKIPTLKNDAVFLYYQKALNALKAEQIRAVQAKTDLNTKLNQINVATEFERRRRIKRAAFNNEDDRYTQDRSTLKYIKQNTPLSSAPLEVADFDFGETQSSNIQILKNIKNIESGFYVVLAVHNDTAKRDAFLAKVVSAGVSTIDFFYDVNTSKYFIYHQKVDTIEAANDALKNKGSQPYTSKLSIIKIEN